MEGIARRPCQTHRERRRDAPFFLRGIARGFFLSPLQLFGTWFGLSFNKALDKEEQLIINKYFIILVNKK
jgi:hypothetical protein